MHVALHGWALKPLGLSYLARKLTSYVERWCTHLHSRPLSSDCSIVSSKQSSMSTTPDQFKSFNKSEIYTAIHMTTQGFPHPPLNLTTDQLHKAVVVPLVSQRHPLFC